MIQEHYEFSPRIDEMNTVGNAYDAIQAGDSRPKSPMRFSKCRLVSVVQDTVAVGLVSCDSVTIEVDHVLQAKVELCVIFRGIVMSDIANDKLICLI